jgi:diadenosine tetraphosphate (Ap4A) HIT family hydrolase
MSDTDFTLHPQLAADCLDIGDWPLCRLLRMNDSTYPWLILVPRVPGARDMIDLSETDQQRLMGEIAEASRILRQVTRAEKLNVAALGNVVPQLHVHVIARFAGDAAWPKPIWGVTPPVPYPVAAAEAEAARWRVALAPAA